MLGPLTYLDVGLIAICAISGLLAMYRGLTRELLSIMSWALAALAALYVVLYRTDWAQQLADEVLQSVQLAQIVIGSVVFVVTLLIVHLITVRFSDRVLDSRVGMIDRFLGFIFGVARGFLIIVILFVFASKILKEDSLPFWVNNAQSIGVLRNAGKSIEDTFSAIAPDSIDALRNSGESQ